LPWKHYETIENSMPMPAKPCRLGMKMHVMQLGNLVLSVQMPNMTRSMQRPFSRRNQMEIRPIKTNEDYQAVLAEIEQLFDAVPDTPEGDRLEVLTTLVKAYEQHHFRIPTTDPIETIRYHMKTRGLSRQDLEAALGSRARVSEVLNHKRSLSLSMIRNLHNRFGIPAEALIQPCQLAI
jgi:HTH-type transcriptional regulator/antitoxin HigA